MLEKVNEILDLWFGPNKHSPQVQPQLWWSKAPKDDAMIRDRFSLVHRLAASGQLESWRAHPLSSLAYIILLDQFSRVLNRNEKAAFENDGRARQACFDGRNHKFDKELHPIMRLFYYMPLEHSERLEDQNLSVYLIKTLYSEAYTAQKDYAVTLKEALHYAQVHYDIIHNYGRFPHRNKILGRESTQDEMVFLAQSDLRL